MVRYLPIFMLGSIALAQTAVKSPSTDAVPRTPAEVRPADPASVLPPLPSAPGGKSTVIGGVIRDVDPVLDEMSLRVFGGGPMKIYFDERTQVYRDGRKTDLAALHPNDRASVETVLDGDDVFALSVHMLSKSPEGETQGQVESYSAATGQLTVRDAVSQNPITLQVNGNTVMSRHGQTTFVAEGHGVSDLAPGSLVSVTFTSDTSGHGVARQISVLATPGAVFSFVGTISFLDLSSQFLSITDPRDGRSYRISFDTAAMPQVRSLHEGQRATVRASFDGRNYTATSITPE